MNRSFEPWTPEEEEWLAKVYRRYGPAYASRELGRSLRAVIGRAHELRLGAPKRRWSAEEDAYLERHYGEATAIEIAEDLDRTEQSVRARVHTLGLGEFVGRTWTSAETAYLKKQYGKKTVQEIADHLGRTHPSVEMKATRLGLSWHVRHEPLSARQIKEIVQLFGTMPMTEIAERFNSTVHIIGKIARDHGYRERPTSREWTATDDADLRDLYSSTSIEEIARRLDRTVVAISWRAGVLGLKRPVNRGVTKLWSHKEVARLRHLEATMSIDEIAKKLGRTQNSVRGKLQLLRAEARAKTKK